MRTEDKEDSGSTGFLRNMLLYGIIGVVCSGTDAVLFSLLTYAMGVTAIAANVFSVLTGITMSFALNRRYNFRVFDNTLKRAIIFFTVGIIGLALSSAIIWVGLSAGYEPIVVKLVSIIVVAAVQFALNKFVSFGIKF